MSCEIRYYRGLHKVQVVTQSEGYWTVQALEEFKDKVDGLETVVIVGEQRIVPPNLLFKQKSLPPMIKEHAYELQMEKKLKQLVGKGEHSKKKQAP